MGLLRKLVCEKEGGEEDNDEIKNIINNLNNILNTRRDYGFFLNDFGIPDHHHINSKDLISLMVINEVTKIIELFEPRMKLIDIVKTKDERGFCLSFNIECIVKNTPYSLVLSLDQKGSNYKIDL
jgi:predicted component of type VI protein secretion system